MSRLEAGAIEPNMGLAHDRGIDRHSIRATHESCKAHKVVTQIAANLPLWYMDASLIEQVSSTCSTTRLVYTAANSTISISAQQSGDSLIIKVADEGLGIDPAVQDKILRRSSCEPRRFRDAVADLPRHLSEPTPAFTGEQSACRIGQPRR